MSRDSFLIAQLSDMHCGSPFFDPQLLHHAVDAPVVPELFATRRAPGHVGLDASRGAPIRFADGHGQEVRLDLAAGISQLAHR